MKKRLAILTLMAAMVLPSMGQIIDPPTLLLGIKGGATATDMTYTQQAYNIYSHTPILDYEAGLFAKYRFSHRWGVMTDIQYNGGGTHLVWSDVIYQLNYRYVDVRALGVMHLGKRRWKMSPYIDFGPVVGVTTGGEIEYSSFYTPHFTTPLVKGEFAALDLGLYGGIGFDYTFYMGYKEAVFSIEAGIRSGFTNTFTKNEKSESSNILNPEPSIPLYTEERIPQGLEVACRLSIPLQKKHKPTRKVPQTVIRGVDPLEPEEVTPIDPFIGFDDEYTQQECYTLGEVRDSVIAGKDISGMRICLFNVLFDFDKYEVRESSYMMLRDLAQLMRMYPQVIIKVNGHTDSRGSDEYNEVLSDNRAKSVRGVIMGYGVDGERIQWQGYGEKYPIDTNETDEGRQRNRRVEIDILTIPKAHQIRLEK